MIHNKLTNHQIAEAFGDTLSLIYKDKMAELQIISQPIQNHLDSLMIPQIPEWQRDFARIAYRNTPEFIAMDHIQKIRRIYKNMKDNPEQLNIQKAKAVPIASIYDFTVKKNMMNCPFHTDKTASMKINKDNTVHCFSCGFHGDSIAFFMKINKFDFLRAVEGLNRI